MNEGRAPHRRPRNYLMAARGVRETMVGGPWLDVVLPPGTEITLTLRLRTRVRPPSVRTPWRPA